jgi:hypothetical protein
MVINSEIGSIVIVDRHNSREGYYVGRPSILGNPFSMRTESDREMVIAKYEIWLREQYRNGGNVRNELIRLACQFKENGSLILGCWCSPRRCHAEIIAKAVIGIASRLA